MSITLWALGSALIVSLIALLAATPLLIRKELPKSVLVVLLSVSVGTLLATTAFHFLPEVFADHGHEVHVDEPHVDEVHLDEEHHNETGQDHHDEAHEEEDLYLTGPLMILVGFLTFFILEKLVHHHHSHKEEEVVGHGHAYHVAPINLIGDGVHNFIDGVVIAASYAISIPAGIAATVSVLFHELPQEIADIGVLLYAGLSRMKAVLFNLFTALTALIGVGVGLIFVGNEHFIELTIPFAAGMFIYIAASNLVPELHRDCGPKDTVIHVLSITAGIALVAVLYVLLPHAH